MFDDYSKASDSHVDLQDKISDEMIIHSCFMVYNPSGGKGWLMGRMVAVANDLTISLQNNGTK